MTKLTTIPPREAIGAMRTKTESRTALLKRNYGNNPVLRTVYH